MRQNLHITIDKFYVKKFRMQVLEPLFMCKILSGCPILDENENKVNFLLQALWIMLGFTLQMKGRWESNINVWIPLMYNVMYSQKWNCYFQYRIIMFCLPVTTLTYLWEIYIFPGSVCLFCCREIRVCGPIWGIHKSLTDTWMCKLGLSEKKYINGISLQCIQTKNKRWKSYN